MPLAAVRTAHGRVRAWLRSTEVRRLQSSICPATAPPAASTASRSRSAAFCASTLSASCPRAARSAAACADILSAIAVATASACEHGWVGW